MLRLLLLLLGSLFRRIAAAAAVFDLLRFCVLSSGTEYNCGLLLIYWLHISARIQQSNSRILLLDQLSLQCVIRGEGAIFVRLDCLDNRSESMRSVLA